MSKERGIISPAHGIHHQLPDRAVSAPKHCRTLARHETIEQRSDRILDRRISCHWLLRPSVKHRHASPCGSVVLVKSTDAPPQRGSRGVRSLASRKVFGSRSALLLVQLTIQRRERTRSILVSEIVNLAASDTDQDQPESEPQQPGENTPHDRRIWQPSGTFTTPRASREARPKLQQG